MYSPMVPSAIYGMVDLVLLVNKLNADFISRATRTDKPITVEPRRVYMENVSDGSTIEEEPNVEIKNERFFKLNDPDPLSNLSHVDYALFDKTGTLTNDIFFIDSICIKDNLFQIDHKELGRIKKKSFYSTAVPYHQVKQNDLTPFKNAISHRQELIFRDFEDEDPESPGDSMLGDQINNSIKISLVGREILESSGLGMTFKTPKRGLLLGEDEAQKINISSSKVQMDDSHVLLGPGDISDSQRFSPLLEKKKLPNSFVEELASDSNTDLKVFLKTLALCHNAKITSETLDKANNKLTYSSERKDEVTTLDFASKCQYVFLSHVKEDFAESFELKIKSQKEKYEIIGVNPFDYQRGRFSIVLKSKDKELQSGYAVLLCKGSFPKMRNQMNISIAEAAILEESMKSYSTKGMKGVVFGLKHLSLEQTQEFQKKYQNLKHGLIEDIEARHKLACDIESKLQFVGMLGIGNEIRPHSDAIINFLKDLKIKIWMLSGDGPESTINAASQLKIINNTSGEIYHFIDESEENLTVYIKNILRDFKALVKPHELPRVSLLVSDKERRESFFDEIFNKNARPKTSFDVSKAARDYFKNKITVLNGESLNKIIANLYLRTHFTFIASLIPTLIGYNLTPQHKSFLTTMIKSYFGDSPTVLAVGDAFNDSLMLKDADIGVEIAHKDEKGDFTGVSNSGDIVISDLDQLNDLLIVVGRKHSEQIENTIYFAFYRSMLLSLTFFFFNWYSSFTGPSINESLLIFCYQFFFSSFMSLIFALCCDFSNAYILRKFFSLYGDGRLKKKKFITRFCLRAEAEAIIHSIVIFYFNIYISDNAINELGQNTDFQILSTNQLWIILLVQYLRILIVTRFSPLIPLALTFITSILIIIGYIGVVNSYNLTKFNLFQISFETYSRTHCLLGFFMIIGICFLFSYCYHSYLIPLFDPSLYEKYAILNNDGLSHMNFSNKIIAAKNVSEKYKMEVSNKQLNYILFSSLGYQIKRIFKNVNVMDDLIQEMLNPADIDTNDLKIRSYSLKFMDHNLEKKYQHIRARKSLFMFQSIFVILILSYALYTLCICIVEKEEFYSHISFIVLFLVILFIFQLLDNQNYYQTFMKIFLLCLIGVKVILDWFEPDLRIGLGSMLIGLISTINLSVDILFLLSLNFIHLALFLSRMLVIYNTEVKGVLETEPLMKFYIICSSIFLVLMCHIFCVYLNYKFEKLKRNDFLASAKLEIDRQIREDILSILVPKFVKDYMNQGLRTIQEEQKDVCILFCDICDFDSIMKIEKKNIIEMLDNLFRIYDNLCITHGIQKIETVGKTYMACAGIKACDYLVPHHILIVEKSRRVVNMAFDMMREVENVTYNSGQDKIKIKIGIHTGKVIAGVIGLHKPQFSLIGDTVNTTSRVCSTGESGIITISEEVYEKLKGCELTFVKRVVEAKGKGLINTYQVNRVINNQNLQNIVQMILNIKQSKFKKTPKPNLPKDKFKSMTDSAVESRMKNTHRASSTIKIISNYFATRLSLAGRMSVNFSSKSSKAKKEKSRPSKFNTKNKVNKELEVSNASKFKNMKDNPIENPPPAIVLDEKNPVVYSEVEEDESEQVRAKLPSRSRKKKSTKTQFNFIFEEESKYEEDDDLDGDASISAQILKPSKLFKLFDKSQLTLVGEFLEDLKIKYQNEIKLIIFIVAAGNVFQMLISLSVSKYFDKELLIMPLRAILSLFLISLIPFVRFFFTGLKTARYLMILALSFGLIVLGMQNYFLNKDDSALKTVLFMEISLLYFVASNLSALYFVESIFISIVYFATCLVSTYLKSTEFNISFFFFYLTFTIVNVLKINYQINQSISSFNHLQINQSKRIQQEALVSQLLPMHAFEKLRTISITNKLALTDVFYDVTLLYADIAGFTNYSSSVEPEQVVLMIKKLFTEFDKNCLKYRVYKVYTIGDCYVVMGFINASQRSPLEEAKNVVKMGLSMIDVIRQVRKAINFMGLDMRIGIHTGTVIGGIIGTDIVRYDIYGKDVSIANKMESNGQIGAIMVSEATKNLLEKDKGGCRYRFEKKTDVEVKSEEKTIAGYLLYQNEDQI